MAMHKIRTNGNPKLVDGHLEFLYEQNQNIIKDMTRLRMEFRELHARTVLPSFWRRVINRWKSRHAGERPS